MLKYALITLPILVYALASMIATLDLFPDGFMEYWWFDDVMHITVFGSMAGSLMYISQHYLHRFWPGVVVATTLAVVDEFSQLFFPARAFSIYDLQMSLVGIIIITALYYLYCSAIKKNS